MLTLGVAQWGRKPVASQNLMAFYSALFCHPLLFSTVLALLALGSNKTVHYTVIAFPVRTCLWIPTCKAGQCCIVCSGFISRLWVLFSCFTREQDSVESGKFGRLRCSLTHNFNSIIYYSFNYFKECPPKWTLNTESYWKDIVWDHYHSWVSRALKCLFYILSSFIVVCQGKDVPASSLCHSGSPI